MNAYPKGNIRPFATTIVEMALLVDVGLIAFVLWATAAVLLIEWEAIHTSLMLSVFILYGTAAKYSGLYKSWCNARMLNEIGLAWLSWSVALLILVFVIYVFDIPIKFAHGLIGLWFVLGLSVLAIYRTVLRILLRWFRMHGRNCRTVAIVGATDIGSRLEHYMQNMAWIGLNCLGTFDDRVPDSDRTMAVDTVLRGSVNDLIEHAKAGEVDIVYLALSMGQEVAVKNVMDALSNTTVTVYLVPDYSQLYLLRAHWEVLGNIPMVGLVDTPNKGYGGVLKATIDVVLAGSLIVLLALPMFLVAAGVLLTSPGPVIFRQTRYGLNGREFKIWKFRTMTVCEDRDEFQQAVRNDPRVTKFGAFLRRTSIDELPQLFNVLMGDMSIVGPRPHPVAMSDQQRNLINRYMQRYKVKPGITGWAQVNGARGETDTLEKIRTRVRLDLEYIDNWTIWLDLKIIYHTIRIVLNDANAY